MYKVKLNFDVCILLFEVITTVVLVTTVDIVILTTI